MYSNHDKVRKHIKAAYDEIFNEAMDNEDKEILEILEHLLSLIEKYTNEGGVIKWYED